MPTLHSAVVDARAFFLREYDDGMETRNIPVHDKKGDISQPEPALGLFAPARNPQLHFFGTPTGASNDDDDDDDDVCLYMLYERTAVAT